MNILGLRIYTGGNDVEYLIYDCEDLKEMQSFVQYKVEDGWCLQGGISIAFNKGKIHYAQAFTRECKSIMDQFRGRKIL